MATVPEHAVTALLAASALVAGSRVTATAADPIGTAQCVYTPALPATVSVGQSVVGLTVPVTITAVPGVDCSSNFDASEHLVHGTDSYFLTWDDNSTTDTESLYAVAIDPGVYRTAGDGNCYASPADSSATYTCAVGSASTTIKFKGYVALTAKRQAGKNKKITLAVRATRFDAIQSRAAVSDTVSIQRYSAGAWHTVHTAAASAAKGYTWTYTDAARATYRAVSATSATSWAATSSSVTR